MRRYLKRLLWASAVLLVFVYYTRPADSQPLPERGPVGIRGPMSCTSLGSSISTVTNPYAYAGKLLNYFGGAREHANCLVSPGRKYFAMLNPFGVLSIIFLPSMHVIWKTEPPNAKSAAWFLYPKDDGNLEIAVDTNFCWPVWESHTSRKPLGTYSLKLWDDGSLILYSGQPATMLNDVSRVVWRNSNPGTASLIKSIINTCPVKVRPGQMPPNIEGPPSCPIGTLNNGTQCVAVNQGLPCVLPNVEVEGTCVPACSAGTHRAGLLCLSDSPTAPPVCEEGYHLEGNVCMPDDPPVIPGIDNPSSDPD